jgi:hypothetical protein
VEENAKLLYVESFRKTDTSTAILPTGDIMSPACLRYSIQSQTYITIRSQDTENKTLYIVGW